MSEIGHHAEWLALIDVSGPFLAEPVLKDAFPQGLEGLDSAKTRTVRQAYDEWREALDLDDPDFPKIHRAWTDLVLKQVLELDENGRGDVLKLVQNLPKTIQCEVPEHAISLRPDYAVVDGRADSRPLILIVVYGAEVSLTESLKGDSWAASPAERMVELCRATDVRLGLATNGEQWMLVDAPVGAVTTFASWYARLWAQEPVTLQAFVNLLGVRRFFVDRSQQLPALLDNSLKFQDEVTDALGEQVRRAVEVLIQALDRADVDRNRELLEGVEPAELYEAGLTVMMRIVFLLSAEERGLLLLGDERYEANYAVSTLRMQLRKESEEILERRWDAWSRLLSIFRAVYGGIAHDAIRLPPFGGSLFDPDRFPFLEGRRKGSRWKIDPATPLPIDNRTVLYLLDSVQLFQGRTLSYLALDIEQIGYVYEGLLERTVVRAKEATLDLDATKNAKTPWVSLPELDDAAARGRQAVEALLKDRTASSAARIRNDLDKEVDEGSADQLLTACHADRSLRDRIRPYFRLLRTDRWGYPLIYPKGAFMVASGVDRRDTGTHYTPKSLTEAIVKDTLEPLVYVGPAMGKPRNDWLLKSPTELLELKICDPAMGSGAFLVQVCRWLSERLVEAWAAAEEQGKAITAEGETVDDIGSREPLRNDVQERLLIARRMIAERCLYGIDMNHLAVELAKLSIWLVTLAKGRPFGFLDHNLRCGDSLLGITNLEQLHYLNMNPGKGSSKKLFASNIDQTVSRALELRSELRRRPIRDIRDVEAMAHLDEEARTTLELTQLIADAFTGEVLAAGGRDVDTAALAIDVGNVLAGKQGSIEALSQRASRGLCTDLDPGNKPRRTLHWPLAFPEVFSIERRGFDAFVGNPPFTFGKNVTAIHGSKYNSYLVSKNPRSNKNVDIVAHFLFAACSLVSPVGAFGFLATSSIAEGATRQASLDLFIDSGLSIISATTKQPWPGKANVLYCKVIFTKQHWIGTRYLDGSAVDFIDANLTSGTKGEWSPQKLVENEEMALAGVIPNGAGFILKESEARMLTSKDPKYKDVVWPYITGEDINSDTPSSRYIINFWDWDLSKAEGYPEALEIVRERVVPHRRTLSKGKERLRRNWWLYEAISKTLCGKLGIARFIGECERSEGASPTKVIATARISKTNAFAIIDPAMFAFEVVVFPAFSYGLFTVLQSNIHIVFAWQHGGKMKADLRYSPTMCVETFPFPETDGLDGVGRSYENVRKRAVAANDVGLTTLYNLFHDERVQEASITALRESHKQLDDAVARAYGWNDLLLDHGFHQVPYLPEGKNTRFTISESARLEVLRRLSKLNKIRFAEHERSGSGTKSVNESEASIADASFEDSLFKKRGGKA